MGKKKKIGMNFALQATILAVASIISKLIGMIYNIPFANILKEEGNGYYGRAQTIYALILLIATFSIPVAISKIMAERIEKGEYRNVRRIFRGSMVYVLIVGGIAAIITYVFAPYMVKEVRNAVLSLRMLAPTVFLSGFLSVYRGYYQAYGNMVPTSISQIVEQVFNAVVSIVAALALIKWATVRGMTDSEIARYGAAGGTIGTGVAVLAGLVYMMLLFHSERKELDAKIKADTTSELLSYRQVIKLLLMIATPIIFSSFIYNVNVTLDMKIFDWLFAKTGADEAVISAQYALYNRYYMVLANVPIAMAAAVASAIIPRVSSSYSDGNVKECNRRVQQSLELAMTLTMPCAVGFAVLAKPIVRLIYYNLSKDSTDTVAILLILGGLSIVLYGISSVLNSVLQGIGKVNIPVISAASALVLHVFLLIPLLLFTDIGVYSLIFATLLYVVIIIAINMSAIRKTLGFKMQWKSAVWVPLSSSVVMGIVAVIVYMGCHALCIYVSGERMANAVAVIFAIMIAAVSYFIAIVKLGGYTREMLEAFPKGAVLARIAGKLHLLKE
ncbi:MAG: polysaccharide biosynthesis protein [Lachnospiraceae bacterium]|nr:polysaccharide biosynthesis protein [Lachnospiraceae bacterium]